MATPLLILAVSTVVLLSVDYSLASPPKQIEQTECMSNYEPNDEITAFLTNYLKTGVLVKVNSTDIQCIMACIYKFAGEMTNDGYVVINPFLEFLMPMLSAVSKRTGRKVGLKVEAVKEEFAKCNDNEIGRSCTSEYQRLLCVQDLFKEGNIRNFLLVE